MSSSLRFFSLAAWVTAVTAGVACGISADQIGDGNGGFASAVSSSSTGTSTSATTPVSTTVTTTTATTVTTGTTTSTNTSTTSAGGAGGAGGAMGGGGMGGAAHGGGGAGQGGVLNGGGGGGAGAVGGGGAGAAGGPPCGNGTLDSTEECDDHNLVNGDGCDKNCHLEQKDSAGNCATGGPAIKLAVGQTVWIAGDTRLSTKNQFDVQSCPGASTDFYYRVTTVGQGQLTATLYPAFDATLDIFKDCTTAYGCNTVGAANSGFLMAPAVTTGGGGATVNQLVVVDGGFGNSGTFLLELAFN